MAAGVNVLVVNAGSSSLKLRVLDKADAVTASADLPAPRGAADNQAIEAAIRSFGAGPGGWQEVSATGHRIVHGGSLYTAPVLIDARVREQLDALTDLAPLHQPKSLVGLDAVRSVLPDVPAVACFDTAFHATMPSAAATYALPSDWRRRWGLRRYGFHGLSHAYASRRAAELMARAPEQLRIITCHLGAGASLTAVRGGRSVDTTMGFTPLEGLVMATRSGNVDPGLMLWLTGHAGMAPGELGEALEHRSGLLGLAGTADMREVVAGAGEDDADCVLALEVYLHRLRGSIAAMAAAMDGADALVFTGGVGENSPQIRSGAMEGLSFLGVGAADPARNQEGAGDREIGRPGDQVRAFVINAREDIEIAREVRTVLR